MVHLTFSNLNQTIKESSKNKIMFRTGPVLLIEALMKDFLMNSHLPCKALTIRNMYFMVLLL